MGGKAALLKLALDWAVAGDDEPIAMADRPAVKAIQAEPDPRQALMLWVQTVTEVAARSAIHILGDIAIFVNMDSSDVWVHPDIFELDEELQPIRVAGVPIKMTATPGSVHRRGPLLGEDTRRELRRAGLTEAEIQALIDRRAALACDS